MHEHPLGNVGMRAPDREIEDLDGACDGDDGPNLDGTSELRCLPTVSWHLLSHHEGHRVERLKPPRKRCNERTKICYQAWSRSARDNRLRPEALALAKCPERAIHVLGGIPERMLGGHLQDSAIG